MTIDPDRPPVPERPLLRGERTWLRPLEDRDLPAYVAGINDSEVGAPAGYAFPISLEQAREWLQHVNEDHQRGRGHFFAVCELGDDRFIGTTWLKDLNFFIRTAELAIFMDHDHIGSGWGTDAQRVLLRFAFRTLGLERLSLTVFPTNERAIRSYRRLGFQEEGVMRRSWRSANGLEDSLLMALLRDEWEARSG